MEVSYLEKLPLRYQWMNIFTIAKTNGRIIYYVSN